MKKCNLCKSIVDEENECPICHNSLVYEPLCWEANERFAVNKYLFFYILKNIWFSVLCCIIGLLKIIISRPQGSELLFGAVACAVLSLIFALFQRYLGKLMTWMYNEEYSHFKVVLWKYLLGLASIIFFMFV